MRKPGVCKINPKAHFLSVETVNKDPQRLAAATEGPCQTQPPSFLDGHRRAHAQDPAKPSHPTFWMDTGMHTLAHCHDLPPHCPIRTGN